MFFALSEVGWLGLSQAVIAGAVTVTLAIVTKKAASKTATVLVESDRKNSVKLDDAAKMVAEVKTDLQTRGKESRDKLDNAAKMVAAVKDDLKIIGKESRDKLDDIDRTGRNIHYLVNSAMLTQLKIGSLALDRLAVVAEQQKWPSAKMDRQAADQASKLYIEHEKSQKTIEDILTSNAGEEARLAPEAGNEKR